MNKNYHIKSLIELIDSRFYLLIILIENNFTQDSINELANIISIYGKLIFIFISAYDENYYDNYIVNTCNYVNSIIVSLDEMLELSFKFSIHYENYLLADHIKNERVKLKESIVYDEDLFNSIHSLNFNNEI